MTLDQHCFRGIIIQLGWNGNKLLIVQKVVSLMLTRDMSG